MKVATTPELRAIEAVDDAGILPEAVNEGVTTKPAVERWEVRKAKGA